MHIYSSCMQILSLVQYTQSPRRNPSHFSLHLSAAHPRRGNRNVIIPKRIGVPPIRLPAKVNSRNLGLEAAALPLRSISISDARFGRQPGNGIPVKPCLDRSVRSEMVLKTLPGARGELGRGGDPGGRKIRQGGVVGFAVEHEDLVLAPDPQVFLAALGRVGHGDEGDVRVGEGFLGFSGNIRGRRKKKRNEREKKKKTHIQART